MSGSAEGRSDADPRERVSPVRPVRSVGYRTRPSELAGGAFARRKHGRKGRGIAVRARSFSEPEAIRTALTGPEDGRAGDRP